MFEQLFSRGGLSLERLRTFAEVVEARGFTAAAKGDPIRQSQFSRQLRELEEFFGVELLNRGRGRFSLTPAGKELHALVRWQFASLDALQRSFVGQPIELTLGAGESILQWVVLPRLGTVREKVPLIAWTLQNLQTEEIVAQLSDGRTDLGIVRKDAVPKSLRTVDLGIMEFAFFVPKERLGGTTSPHLGKLLNGCPIAAMEGASRLNDGLEELARKQKFKLKIELRCSSLPQIAEAVANLGFAALLPIVAKPRLSMDRVETRKFPELKRIHSSFVLAWNSRPAAIRPILQRTAEILGPIMRLT